jgi:parallel beta-helix repeat protein
VLVSDGGHVDARGNVVRSSQPGIGALGPGTRIDVSGGRLEPNESGIDVAEGAAVTANGVAIIGGAYGARLSDRGSCLKLRDCRVSGPSKFGIWVGDGATVVFDGGEIQGAYGGVFAKQAGTNVTIRGASVHGNRETGISIGAAAEAILEDNDVFDNAYPGIVTVGGHVRVLRNRVHDNQSNGIAIREGADAVVEANDVWGNKLPAITVVGPGTHATVRENTVRDNVGQGIYVYQGASAEIIGNRLTGNGEAAITISDGGTSASIEHNVVENSHGSGLWVADGATATLEHNEILGVLGTAILAAGIVVNDGASVEARENVVRDAPIGVVVECASGSFVRNRLLGNTGGSWCLIDPGSVTRDANEEETLTPPGWAAPLDAGRYVLLALRVGAELGCPPREVELLDPSTLSLTSLAAMLRSANLVDYAGVVRTHLAAVDEAARQHRVDLL